MVSVVNLLNNNRHELEVKRNFHVIEFDRDISCNPQIAQVMYFMSEMNIRKRQLLIQMNDDKISQRGPHSETSCNIIYLYVGSSIRSPVPTHSGLIALSLVAAPLMSLPAKSRTPFIPVVACTFPASQFIAPA